MVIPILMPSGPDSESPIGRSPTPALRINFHFAVLLNRSKNARRTLKIGWKGSENRRIGGVPSGIHWCRLSLAVVENSVMPRRDRWWPPCNKLRIGSKRSPYVRRMSAGVLLYFVNPQAHENHAERAVRALRSEFIAPDSSTSSSKCRRK